VKANTESHQKSKSEEEKQRKLEEEKKEAAISGSKMPLMFIDEVNKTLDKGDQGVFKDALTQYKLGKYTEIDQFTDMVRISYY
jgi:hypothetical protein